MVGALKKKHATMQSCTKTIDKEGGLLLSNFLMCVIIGCWWMCHLNLFNDILIYSHNDLNY